jgi:hypothetical protein
MCSAKMANERIATRNGFAFTSALRIELGRLLARPVSGKARTGRSPPRNLTAPGDRRTLCVPMQSRTPVATPANATAVDVLGVPVAGPTTVSGLGIELLLILPL